MERADSKKGRVLVAMSGGVDSAASALYLLREGYDVVGVTMLFCEGESSEKDAASAAETARFLGMEHRVLDCRKLFRDEVIVPFCAAYAAGKTPNPCVLCNFRAKFGALCAEAARDNFDHVATGHYVNKEWSEKYNRYVLKKADDPRKDQSYMLAYLSREQAEKSLFPLGHAEKSSLRQELADAGLTVAARRDSQDICFVPDGDYAPLVEKTLGETFPEGHFVTTDGRVLGTHKGLIRYTVGQRKGLGLALPAPLYVKEKRTDENAVVLCPEEELYTSEFAAVGANWQAFDALPETGLEAFVKTRYSQKESPCFVTQNPDGSLRVSLRSPARAVTPGQTAAFYDNDSTLLGGAEIQENVSLF